MDGVSQVSPSWSVKLAIMDYVYVKHWHQFLAVFSLLLFWLRVILRLTHRKWLQSKWLRVLPHVNDSLLLVAGIWMCYLLTSWPWQLPWLQVKLAALLAYIGVASYCLKVTSSRAACLLAAAGATGIYIYIAGVAISKSVYSWWELYGH
ncbi:SirB2 family protein [Motilimonas sp. 1_MG-2023]|uniref:SirB2 family protein n=1 Tax=Motilimonas sp. 1_MG-2023 TaxID=3062672 RepID=UPI0026E14907|nr:SirB2 family protein [Motilimonas sp. 1_MG-2023]MDO6524851.1 SirB2 family protein [Motilimonas sp. 1_MG-2023]